MSETAACPIEVGRTLAPVDFAEIRRAMQIEHCKWDTQVGDETTLAPFPLLLSRSTWTRLAKDAEDLARETLACEEGLFLRPDLHRRVALPRALRGLLRPGGAPLTPGAARVMRFDFHWTTEGWRVSEVNSDVPGGYTEAECFAELVAERTPGALPAGAPARAVAAALAKGAERGVVALLSAPGYLEDQQVIAHLARRVRERGLAAHLVSPNQVRWHDGEARVDTASHRGPVDAIVRFYQAEWLAKLPRSMGWEALFAGGRTPVLNPGVAALGESKRLPIVWDDLGLPLPAWRRLAPETRDPARAPWRTDERWVLKQAYCNTGDTVFMRSAVTRRAWAGVAWRALAFGGSWAAQRRFDVVPLATPIGAVYPCLGVFTVDGRAAGLYGHISRRPIVTFAAIDVAVLVREEAQ